MCELAQDYFVLTILSSLFVYNTSCYLRSNLAANSHVSYWLRRKFGYQCSKALVALSYRNIEGDVAPRL